MVERQSRWAGVVESSFRRAGSGWEALPEHREALPKGRSGWEALPEHREALPKGGSGWETLPEDQ